MKLFRPGGAISVFLVIILVPCLVLCFLYVDLSRIELSKSSVESTADTTLNSLMANYDTVLSDYYGLVGSVQNIDEYCTKSKEFFEKTLKANGVSEDMSNEIVSWVFNTIASGDDYSDMLQASMVAGTDNIYPVEGSGLGENPVLIKEGIVEFMKYRAPELALESIYDKLAKSGSTIANDLEKSAEDSELADSRNEFAETEGELNKKEFYTYYYYQLYAHGGSLDGSTTGPSTSEITDIGNYVEDSVQYYKDLTKKTYESLWISKAGLPGTVYKKSISMSSTADADGLITNLAVTTSGGNEKKTAKDVKTSEKDGTYYITWKKLSEQKTEVENKITALNNALKSADTAVGNYASKNYGTGDDQTNKAQWFYFASKAASDSISKVNSAGDDLAKSYVKFLAMLDCDADPDDTEFPSGWESTCGTTKTSAKTLLENVFSKFSVGSGSDGDKYLTVLNELANVSNDARSQCSTTDASSKLKEISEKLANYRKALQTYVDLLSHVIEGDKAVLKKNRKAISLDDLEDLVWEYSGDYDDWSGKAKASDTTLGDQQKEDVAKYEAEKRTVDGDDVENFKQKLLEEKAALESIIDAIDALKFGKKKLTDISSFDTFYKQLTNGGFTVPTEPMTNSDMKSKAESMSYSLLEPKQTEKFIPDPSCKLILEQGDDTYYDFLISKYQKGDLEDEKTKVDKEDSKLDEYKDKGENEENSEENQKEKDGSDANISTTNISEAGTSSARFKDTDIIKSFAKTIGSFASLKGTDARDSLYATLYAMNMFSYRTYVYEGKYADYTDGGSKSGAITYSNCDSIYSSLNSNWQNTDAKYTYNKTLTNKMISSANNVANNAEIEYILYGGTNTENIKSAYTSIYGLRLVLNLASGFINFWDKDNATSMAINGVALAIEEATYFIIPAAVTKCVLISMLAALESLHDMKVLNKGLPLEVYKSSDEQWAYSLSPSNGDDTSVNSPKDTKNGSGVCMQYSEYMFLFLYSMLEADDDGTKQAYTRIGQLINANMKLKDSSFSLKNSKTLFTITTEIEVSPMMMDLSLASDYRDSLGTGSWNKFTVTMTRGY